MRRLLLLNLLIPALLFGQEQTLRFRPPFAGLYQNTNQLDIPDNGFFTLSNAALTYTGEIYKRGGLSTLDTIKIDSNTSSSNGPVNAIFRFSKTNGSKKLLANYLGGSSSSAQFSLWYWLNDYGRFCQTYSNSPDTVAQIMYNQGTVFCTTSVKRIYGVGTNFFLRASNLSPIKFRANGTAINLASTPQQVYILNDTVLELADGTAPDSTCGQRKYELWYRSAHSGNTPYYTEAASYLDTSFFSRSIADPVGWDSAGGTIRLNVVDWGVADTVRDTSIIDLSKSWTTNQWAGFWLFKRMQLRTDAAHGYLSNWIGIQGNTATKLILDSAVSGVNGTGKEYAIVSMPIDQPLTGIRTVSTGGASPFATTFHVDTSLGTTAYKSMLMSPLTAYVVSGVAKGQTRTVDGFGYTSGDSIVTVQKPFFPAIGVSVTGDTSKIIFLRSRFPICKFVEKFHERTLWVCDTSFQNSYWWSQPSRPGYIQPNDFNVVNPNDGEVIQAVWSDANSVNFGKESKIYQLLAPSVETSGDDPALWQLVLLYDKRGVSSQKSVVKRGDRVWFYDWPDGFFEFHDPVNPISDNIRAITDSITPTAINKVWGVYYPSRRGDFILWGVPLNGSATPNRVLCYSPKTNAWSQWDIKNTDTLRIASALVQEGSGDSAQLMLGLADSGYVLRYNPDASVDTLNGYSTPTRTTTFSLIAESKRFALLGQQIRFWEIEPTVFSGGTATIAYDFYKNLSTTSIAQIAYSHAAGWTNTRKSLSDAVVGNQLAWRITTSSPQTFRLGGLDIKVITAGNRLPE